MASPTQNFVVYFIIPPVRGSSPLLFSRHQVFLQQQHQVKEFLEKEPSRQLVNTYVENTENYLHHFTALKSAIACCNDKSAHLIIPAINNLTCNDTFVNEILHLVTDVDIFCLDKPHITTQNFALLVEHDKQQRQRHREAVINGLRRRPADHLSGNPNANNVINKVNKPKIDNAITFALMLQPVIQDLQKHGLSQRKMVDNLNQENFTAPEGGLWVLSQLQKVLERIKLNETALAFEDQFKEYQAHGYDFAAIAVLLNQNGIRFGREFWTAEDVEKVTERIKQLDNITKLYNFISKLIPIIEKYQIDELTPELLNQELQQTGLSFPLQEPPDELYRRVVAVLRAAISLEKVFCGNPNYEPYVVKARTQGSLADIQESLFELIKVIAPCAQKIVAPSFEIDLTAFRRKF
ncbi:MAG: hypothetical protein ACHQJ6_07585 [Candidatus Berkiellales bacterium]